MRLWAPALSSRGHPKLVFRFVSVRFRFILQPGRLARSAVGGRTGARSEGELCQPVACRLQGWFARKAPGMLPVSSKDGMAHSRYCSGLGVAVDVIASENEKARRTSFQQVSSGRKTSTRPTQSARREKAEAPPVSNDSVVLCVHFIAPHCTPSYRASSNEFHCPQRHRQEVSSTRDGSVGCAVAAAGSALPELGGFCG